MAKNSIIDEIDKRCKKAETKGIKDATRLLTSVIIRHIDEPYAHYSVALAWLDIAEREENLGTEKNALGFASENARNGLALLPNCLGLHAVVIDSELKQATTVQELLRVKELCISALQITDPVEADPHATAEQIEGFRHAIKVFEEEVDDKVLLHAASESSRSDGSHGGA